jgi:hypothetical protein
LPPPTQRGPANAKWQAAVASGQPITEAEAQTLMAAAREEDQQLVDAATREDWTVAHDRAHLEAQLADPGFYEEKAKATAALSKHQQLMWEVGDLMNQWESLASQN